MAQNKKRKSIRSALKRARILESVTKKITPRAIRLAVALEKARKEALDGSNPVEFFDT